MVSIHLFLCIVLDHHPFQKLTMPFFQEGKGLTVVSIVLQGLLHELKAGVILVQDFSPSLHAYGEVRALVDQATFGIRTRRNFRLNKIIVFV